MADQIETTTVAAAQATVAGLDAQRDELQARRAALQARLVEQEHTAATRLLAGSGTGKLAADLGQLRQELALADGALALLAARHGPASYALRVAEQRDRREQYAELGVAADALWARVVELWAPIGALTGATADVCRERLPALEALEWRRESLRRDINYRDDFLRPDDQGGVL